ncbi:MAG: hypothetical protein ACWA44_15010 [Thiotrichales bacterium]
MKVAIHLLTFVCLFMVSNMSFSSSSDVVRAKHLIEQVDSGLSRIKQNDVNTINTYTEKLNQARKILEAEKGTQDPLYREAAGQWLTVRDRLYATLDNWKKENAAAKAPEPELKVSSSELYDQLVSKYQSQNRPRLPAEIDIQAGQQWLTDMIGLYSTDWEQDNKKAKQFYQRGLLSKNDYDRFNRWVNGTWHTQIGDSIKQTYHAWDTALNHNLNDAQRIISVSDEDKNKVMNTAGGVHLQSNQSLIINSRALITLVSDAEAVLDKSQVALREQQKAVIAKTAQRLQEMMPLAQKYHEEWEKLPKKSNKNPTSQYLWMNGSQVAEITQKGEVWRNGNFVGSISDNGEIYQKGNYVGVIQDNGELYISSKNISVTLADDGKVWVGGSHVGTISKNGEVWGNGVDGTIEGPGDWRRAAVVYFLKVFPER